MFHGVSQHRIRDPEMPAGVWWFPSNGSKIPYLFFSINQLRRGLGACSISFGRAMKEFGVLCGGY